jgi:hydroxymethylbilane synthase
MSISKPERIILGTRRSALARKQTDIVEDTLQAVFPSLHVQIRESDPLGDRDKTTALYELNNKNLWTGELEDLLEVGEVDAIVHSLKGISLSALLPNRPTKPPSDMPTTLPPGLILGAILKRDSPLDALCMKNAHSLPSPSTPTADDLLSALPPGSLIGTSSLRRTAQLRRNYPHLRFAICRGNVPTRLAKLNTPAEYPGTPDFAALILAAAGLRRLGLEDRISAYLDGSVSGGRCLGAVGQGAIGVEVREGDERVMRWVERLNDGPTRRACLAERSLMRTLEGGCSVPIGVQTRWKGESVLELEGIVVSVDGSEAVEAAADMNVSSDEDAEELGRRVAKALVEKGAGKILDVINEDRRKQQEAARAKIGDAQKYVEQQAQSEASVG